MKIVFQWNKSSSRVWLKSYYTAQFHNYVESLFYIIMFLIFVFFEKLFKNRFHHICRFRGVTKFSPGEYFITESIVLW